MRGDDSREEGLKGEHGVRMMCVYIDDVRIGESGEVKDGGRDEERDGGVRGGMEE